MKEECDLNAQIIAVSNQIGGVGYEKFTRKNAGKLLVKELKHCFNPKISSREKMMLLIVR